jgi:hypothetical protein
MGYSNQFQRVEASLDAGERLMLGSSNIGSL